MQQDTVIVVAGGDPTPGGAACLAPWLAAADSPTVIAADGGVDRALALGLQVDVAVGDFDSVTSSGLAAAVAAGARIERHPAEKDATDLELALDEALALAPARVLVVAAAGGRLDHLLGSLLLLGSDRYAEVELDAVLDDGTRVHVIRRARTIAGETGEIVTLLPLHGRVEGITTTGLAYPLAGETLEAGSSRGVSNVLVDDTASVEVGRGVLLVVRPGERS